MIRHAWAVDISDSSLKDGEWAGVRPSTMAERRLVSAGRRDICCTFAFRQCQRVLRLVVSQEGVKQPFFSTKRKFEKAVQSLTFAHGVEATEPYSASVLASAAVLVPGILSDIHRLSDIGSCGACTCIMKDHGMLDEGSATEVFVLDQLITTRQELESRS
ncbi:hypothetical protein EGT36_03235 [Agrobacterium sp. FDAARGOS_525]|uniref:hypothetical protein n=1 Tax=Agrobacterium sp. FDAARGOS_525 TaxID=2420311 RepID=UPI000F68E712|nr:hypothetical protein [Agrobacterium sp. FDAARGOS_525]RSC36406.1 hypothetical protein EGT36_03235 [Agrobacterium sp. FDAARGOS_525]